MVFCTGAGFWRFIRHIYGGSFLISERFQFLANWVLDMLFHSWLENIEKIKFSWLEILQCIMLGVRYIFFYQPCTTKHLKMLKIHFIIVYYKRIA